MAVHDSTKFVPTSANIGRGNPQLVQEVPAVKEGSNAKRIICSVFVLFVLYALAQADGYLKDNALRKAAPARESRVVEDPGLFAKLFCTGYKRSRYCSF